ncbi:hypothetical protein [Methanosarcina sp. UBA411]|jgi:hypothetical protein|uniref:hypothetical protein n=1 Tax=Methanosarcina sp. UBA411 TaxID=1915589 RepID=UPI0025F685F6|nr:hypothetical protein [Methanosarcina sp. UBA411]
MLGMMIYMNLRISNIILFVMLVNILWNCSLGSCSQNGDGVTENSNNNSENVNNNTQRLPLTFGSGTFEKLKKEPSFIAAYGSMPSFANSEERDQWIDILSKVVDKVNVNFDQEISKYFYPNGSVTGYGITIDGVIQVGINKSIIVDKSFMDEVYQIFDLKAGEMGIKEVPVVFVYEDNPIPLEIEYSELDSKTANSSASEENIVEPNNSNNHDSDSNNESESSKNNSIPSFGLLGSLTCLYGGWRLRKK